MDDARRAIHVLNRLTFGPRPGDVDRIRAMGIDPWIDQQLHPDSIDDSSLDARLAPYRTLRMDTKQIAENFPPPQVIKAVEQGRQSIPSDPLKRAVYEAQLQRSQARQRNKAEPANAADTSGAKSKLTDEEIERRRESRVLAETTEQELLDLPPDQRMKAILKLSPEEQRSLSRSLKGNEGSEFMQGMAPQQREALEAMNNPQAVVTNELLAGKLLRATYGERQLQEVMTDFWFNHFNVFIGKGADRYLLSSYERDVIRPNALGKFEDLLKATAQSPAMLFYLDNWLSVGPDSDVANGISRHADKAFRKKYGQKNVPAKQAKGKHTGLNENYGRELMELHTLGVNGGYTQKDVTEVARVFTGWTLKQPRQGGGFTFEERMHEPGDKVVLGHRIKSKGEKEGFEVLHILAHNSSTARFICTKLAVRFVSDNPPAALVDRMTQTFLKKNGNIGEVMRTMLKSPEFWSEDTYRAKVKTPLEFVVSALRTSGADVTDPLPVARQLQTLGMPLYGMQPPTGYSNKADAWVNSSALLGRMNFAMALTAGKVKGTQLDHGRMPADSATVVDSASKLAMMETNFLSGDVSKQTHDTIAAGAPNASVMAGLLLGSPEFQKR